MPIVAILGGIAIELSWDDHPPAHFHAECGEFSAVIAIDS
jgi:hypothetical protein